MTDDQLVEIAPDRFKPASRCTPQDARGALKMDHQRAVILERCARILDRFPTVMHSELPPLLGEAFRLGELPDGTSIPELKAAWRELARLLQQRSG